MKLFRERLLARLIERHVISETLARKLLAWKHPGFSVHVGGPIPFEDKKAIEDVACYLVRSPLSLRKLVYLDGQKAVLYRSSMNPLDRAGAPTCGLGQLRVEEIDERRVSVAHDPPAQVFREPLDAATFEARHTARPEQLLVTDRQPQGSASAPTSQ
jgi:hypothetical protein